MHKEICGSLEKVNVKRKGPSSTIYWAKDEVTLEHVDLAH